MFSAGLKNICEPLGISSRQLAELLLTAQSRLSMAAAGSRTLPLHLQPWMRLLEDLAENNSAAEHQLLSRKSTTPQDKQPVKKQIRLLLLEQEKLLLRLETATSQLLKMEKCCKWLPILLESPICSSDADRMLAATVLLRQTSEKRLGQWMAVHELRSRLAANNAALAYWQQIDL